jgi:hypothetical protein
MTVDEVRQRFTDAGWELVNPERTSVEEMVERRVGRAVDRFELWCYQLRRTSSRLAFSRVKRRWVQVPVVQLLPHTWHQAIANLLRVLAVSVQLFLEQLFFVADAQGER